jgi:hypothetical protein
MYDVSTKVFVKDIIPDKLIATQWGEPATSVDYKFTSIAKDKTYVVIRNYGFQETGDNLLEVIKDSTGGFTTVLDGLKAYLEYNIQLNLIGDKYPKEISNHGQH